MKKRLIALFLAILAVTSFLSSCKLFGKGNEEEKKDDEQTAKENLIYDEDSELNVIVGKDMDSDLATAFYAEISTQKPNTGWKDTTSEKIEHEIVLGNDTGREVTQKALMLLERQDEKKDSDDDYAYVIYSDGSSVAIVYDVDHDNVSMEMAVDAFVDKFLDTELYHAEGSMETKIFNIIDDYYTPLDEAHRQEILDEAEQKLGTETVNALKSMMGIYDDRLIQWIAGLYDPCICVCLGMGEEECKNTEYCKVKGGGFYYSNSARDTVGFLPDLESTRQALDMLNMSGMTWMYGGRYNNGALPDGMMAAIGRYTQALQCESDGYFRHPQWANRADHDMRLNRDLSWATTLLSNAGMSFWYNTPTGKQGTGKPAASSGELTTNLHKSSPVAVSKVVAVASYPAILESRETFRAELDSLTASLKTSSYGTGSRLGTYGAQISARDRQIGTPDDPTPLMDMLYNWYEENKNPERGTWVGDEEYGGNPKQIGAYAETNGVMKIISTYSSAKKPYSYGIEAMHACIDVLTTEEVPTGTVDIYNAWIALNGVYSAVINYNSPDEQQAARDLMKEFRENCVDEIIASRDKMLNFMCADGSFSYWPNTRGTAGSSMGMPTAVAGTKEGDVNGALIASADCWGHICSSLGITKIPIFGVAEMYKFRKWIESNGAIIKQGASFDYSVVDFEADEVGEESSGNLSYGNNSADTSFLVAEDSATGNKYLEFISKKVTGSSGGNCVFVNCESKATAKSFIFEGDICLSGINPENNTDSCFQIQVGNISYFILAKKSGNKIKLIEQSSDNAVHSIDMDLGVDINMGDWFRLKVVYYSGDHDTVRIKVYFDNLADGEDELKLIAVSDNYWDQYGNKNNGAGKPKNDMSGAKIYALKDFDGTILLDNLASYRSKDVYTPESDPNNQPIYNVDPPESDEVKYDFEDGIISDKITVTGEANVVDAADGKELKLGKDTSLTIPITHRKIGAKCATTAFDINLSSAEPGDAFTMTASEPIGSIYTLIFTVMEDAGGKYLTCCEKNENLGSVLSTVRIPVGEKTRVTVDYHHNEDNALIYVGDTFVAATDHIYVSAAKRTIRTLTITTTAKNNELTLDNIIFEKNLNSYEEATKPKEDSKIHNFDGTLNEDVSVSGGAKLDSYGGSGAVLIPKGGKLTVPVNHRANIYSVVRISVDLAYQVAMSNGETNRITLVDNDGGKVFALAFKVNGNDVELYEVHEGGTGLVKLCSFAKTDTAKLAIDLYQYERIANIYLGGTCVANTSVFASDANSENTPMTLVVESGAVGSKLYVDNLKVETLYELYESVAAKSGANEDTSNPLNFEKSNTGSLPANLVKSYKYFRVENVYNTVKEEYSNVGVLETVRGRNDKFGVSLSKINTQSCIIFETDFMIKNAEDELISQLFFTNEKNEPKGNSALGIIFVKSGNSFSIKGYANDATQNDVYASGLNFGEWYNLRIEYYPNGDADTRVKIFINGKLEYVTNKHYTTGKGNAMTGVKSAFFYTLRDSQASIYVDNMSLTTSDATCNEAIGDR